MPAFTDPYADPDTGVLKNLVGASTWAQLDSREAAYSHLRYQMLMNEDSLTSQERGMLVSQDLQERLRFIHRFLFQDVYEWAGRLRTVNIAKMSDGGWFLPWDRVPTGLEWGFGELRDRYDFFRAADGRDSFIRMFARQYADLNYVHPFREGNGRAQRMFWNTVLKENSRYRVDWAAMDSRENNLASRRAGISGQIDSLVGMFAKIVYDTHLGQTQAPQPLPERPLPSPGQAEQAGMNAPGQGVGFDSMAGM